MWKFDDKMGAHLHFGLKVRRLCIIEAAGFGRQSTSSFWLIPVAPNRQAICHRAFSDAFEVHKLLNRQSEKAERTGRERERESKLKEEAATNFYLLHNNLEFWTLKL